MQESPYSAGTRGRFALRAASAADAAVLAELVEALNRSEGN